MEYLDWTLESPADNLACEEVLLEECERGGREVLRVWEPARPLVVAGYANRTLEGIRIDACRRLDIPVMRRHSGGGTVLLGPGCLNYALILSTNRGAPLRTIRATNVFVMGRLCQALSRLSPWPVRVEGYTDLAVGDRKFSGNAQYRRRGAILFHGTFMLDFDLALIEELLAVPARVPRYRRGRSHLEFLTNLAISRFDLGDALREAWGATASLGESERETLLSQIRARSLVLEI